MYNGENEGSKVLGLGISAGGGRATTATATARGRRNWVFGFYGLVLSIVSDELTRMLTNKKLTPHVNGNWSDFLKKMGWVCLLMGFATGLCFPLPLLLNRLTNFLKIMINLILDSK